MMKLFLYRFPSCLNSFCCIQFVLIAFGKVFISEDGDGLEKMVIVNVSYEVV